jgi:hypothetical protein
VRRSEVRILSAPPESPREPALGSWRPTTLTLAGQLSLLLDRIGYRAMLCESRAENMEQKLENLGELTDIAGGFHSAREFLDHAALATNRERDGDDDMVSLMTLHKATGSQGRHIDSTFEPAATLLTSASRLSRLSREKSTRSGVSNPRARRPLQ